MSYVYRKTERSPGLWTVGHWQPDGRWEPESDHSTEEEAAERARWLNGGASPNPVVTPGPRTIVFEVSGEALSAPGNSFELLVQLWPGETPTVALRQDHGTWGPPIDASSDEDEALRQVAIRTADRMLRQRIEAIPNERLRQELLKSL